MLNRKAVITVASLFARTAMAGGISQDNSTDGFGKTNIYIGLAIIGITITGMALYCMRSHLPRCSFSFGGNGASELDRNLTAGQGAQHRVAHSV